jgi:hypothetical protein
MKRLALIALTLGLAAGAAGQELKLVLGAGSSTYSKPWAPEYWWDWAGRGSGLNPVTNVRVAAAAGFGIELTLRDRLDLEVDLLYFSKGAIYRQEDIDPSDPASDERVKNEYSLQGFALPVLAKLRLMKSPRVYALAGLELTGIVSHRLFVFEQYGVSGPDYQLWRELQLIHETRKIDTSPVLGFGCSFGSPAQPLDLELRYQLGVFDLNREPGEYRVGTRALLLVAGFRI